MFKVFSFVSFRKTILATLIVFLLTGINVFAEKIKLISGKMIEGEIVERNDDFIKMNTRVGIPLTYYLDEIESIDGEPVSPAEEKDIEPAGTADVIAPELVAESVSMVPPDDMDKLVEEREMAESDKSVQAVQTDAPVDPVAEVTPMDVVELEEITDPVAIDKPVEVIKPDEVIEPVEIIEPPIIIAPVVKESKPQPPTEAVVKKATEVDVIPPKDTPIKPRIKDTDEQKIRIQKKLSFIRKKLYQIPLKVRQGILVIVSSFLAVIYVFFCLPLMIISKKLGKKHPWLIWIPVVQIFYLIHMGGKPFWWVVGYVIPLINMIVPLLVVAGILKGLRKSYWLIVPLIIPLLNIFTLWYLALTKIEQDIN